ncbi:hypothetical protein WJX84_009500, partial [Apatococcus fuscideae]
MLGLEGTRAGTLVTSPQPQKALVGRSVDGRPHRSKPVKPSQGRRCSVSLASAGPSSLGAATTLDKESPTISAPAPQNGSDSIDAQIAISNENAKLEGLNAENWERNALSIVVVGASGDLAKKKIFPALFAIFYEGMMPESFNIFGFARSAMSDDEFRDLIASSLTCRVDQKEDCSGKMDYFLDRCFYQPGQYGSEEDFHKLSERMTEHEQKREKADRVFYLSIPPSIFTQVAGAASKGASSPSGWTRVIVEKPFGKDTESFNKLSADLYQHLSEEQMYRIDHYLGKELIENLT